MCRFAWKNPVRTEANSDFQAVKAGYISVTPLHVDLTNYKLLEVVRTWDLGK